MPSRQFCPAANFIDSFHISFSKFHSHGAALTISRSTSHCCLAQNSMGPKSTNKQNIMNGIPPNPVNSDLSSSWLETWKAPYQGNRPKLPRPVLNYRISRTNGVLNLSGGSSSSSVAAVGGGSGSTMDRIVEKLKKFGYMDDVSENDNGQERVIEKGSVEDIFYVEEGMLPDTRGGFSTDSPLGIERQCRAGEEVRFPWEKPAAEVEAAEHSVKRRSRTFMAELTLPESELRRLWHLTLKTTRKLRIGDAGVTQSVVDEIHKRWKAAEIVRLKIEGSSALNMRRMHEILERKTGGLVIWRSGTSVSLYRGVSYEVPSEEAKRRAFQTKGPQPDVRLLSDQNRRRASKDDSHDHSNQGRENFHETSTEKEGSEQEEIKYEDEIDYLLSDLGPRYTDWPGGDPLPVDADLLPGMVHGYQPPFRLLPFGVRRTLSPRDATALRRIARTLPPHFALGRSRQLEGLAAAIVKLWERSSIAKVALKRGVQLTTSERMVEDIKRLTGGTLLSRSKDFLVFYRGKDFLSPDVKEALLERERLVQGLQDEEEARMRASASVIHFTSSASATTNVETEQLRAAGTLYETVDANAKWGKRVDYRDREKMLREAELMRRAQLVRKLDKKLEYAERRLLKAEQALSKVEAFLKPSDRQPDPESITDEERFMFRKLGFKMKAFLLLGRRGVFDGTVENMHLHWKYRELVKIIVKAKNFEDAKNIALSLEAESGGMLVSVDKVSKGYAIIVFRGKDYQRPPALRPKNLLSKRKALARSIELQRRQALLQHIAQLQRNVDKLRSGLEHLEIMEDRRESNSTDYLDAAYPAEDGDSEEDGDEAYLETCNDESEDEYETYVYEIEDQHEFSSKVSS